MTLCLAMKVRDGLVGIADTRVTSGVERITARKVTVHERPSHALFIMTSGLRSVRDKAVTYFEEAIEERDESFDKLYKAVNALATQLRRVADEDKQALVESGVSFDIAAVVGGQLENDREPKLYLLYPQGNWVEVAKGSPYFAIGEHGYGKPLLDRALHYDVGMEDALKIGYLAFDATRTSATDVDFPLDVVVCERDTHEVVEHRYEREDLLHVSEWWQLRMRAAIDECPSRWVNDVFSKTRRRLVNTDRPADGGSG